MTECLFVSDLHGSKDKFENLFESVVAEKPQILFIGGDVLPHSLTSRDFVEEFMIKGFDKLRIEMGSSYPRVMLILGNDDVRSAEPSIIDAESSGVWEYIHNKKVNYGGYSVYGYAIVPPTPFMLKDWEKYDVSRYVSPGCIPPEEGRYTSGKQPDENKHNTIMDDLSKLTGGDNLDYAILLIHSPPHETKLDRINTHGKTIDSVPLDEHVGSIAVRRLIEERQPLLTLHGHIHESASITGSWRDKIGRTHCFNAAHNGKELSLIKFDIDNLENAERVFL